MTRSRDRVDLHGAVVLLEDRPAGREIGAPEEREEHRPRVHASLRQGSWRRGRSPGCRGLAPALGRGGDPVVHDRVRCQSPGRDTSQLPRSRSGHQPTVGRGVLDQATGDHPNVRHRRNAPDDRARETPAPAHGADRRLLVRSNHRQHPFLALGDQHLEWLHAGLPPGDRVEIDQHAGPGSVGRLGRRAGDPTGAEVLETLHETAFDERKRGLDQELL